MPGLTEQLALELKLDPKDLEAQIRKLFKGGGGESDQGKEGDFLGGLSPRATKGVRLVHKFVNEPVEAMIAVLSKVPGVGEPAAAAIELVRGTLGQFTDAVFKFGAAANPAAMKRYQMAFDDTQAVIGRVFAPMLDKFTVLQRSIGDFFATVLPSSAEMEEILRDLDPLMDEFKKLLGEIAPILKTGLIAAIQSVMEALKAIHTLYKAITLPTHAVNVGGKQVDRSSLVSMLQGLSGTDSSLKSSQGAGSGKASFMGLEDYGKNVDLAAYGAGDPNKETAGNTAKIAETTKQIWEAFATAGIVGGGLAIAGATKRALTSGA